MDDSPYKRYKDCISVHKYQMSSFTTSSPEQMEQLWGQFNSNNTFSFGDVESIARKHRIKASRDYREKKKNEYQTNLARFEYLRTMHVTLWGELKALKSENEGLKLLTCDTEMEN